MFRFSSRPKTIFLKVILGCLVSFNILAWAIVWELSSSQGLEVIFFDVGQGDSVFIETENGFQVLIDGGPDLTVLEKLGAKLPFYDRTIDLIILTHPDHDHIFGLLEVLKRYEIKNILWTGVVKDTAEYQEWKKLIKNEGAKLLIAEAGQKVVLQDPSGAYISILHPFESLEGKKFKYYNNSSIVAKLIYGDISFLFTGDISKKVEKQLLKGAKLPAGSLAPFSELSSSVLKVAHHGSKFSSSEEFLAAVLPEIAVISVGENNYGQPDPEVLQLLEQSGIQVLITQELGDIKFAF